MTPYKNGNGKYSTWNRQIWHHKTWCLTKIAHLAKNCSKVIFAKEWAEWFEKEILKFVVWFRLMAMGFQSRDFSTPEWHSWYSPVSNFCKVGFIFSRMLVVLQETNNLVIRCHLCRVTFLGGGIFDKRSALFVTLYQWVQ